MKISKEKLDQLKNFIDEAETIAIASHIEPDGDNLGSTLGFARALRNYGKDVDVIGHDEIDDYLKFLPDLEYYSKDHRDSYDLFFVLDASEMERIGTALPIARNSKKTAVVDHHVGGGIQTDLNIIVDDSPATCELIYEIIDRLNLPLDKITASLLFTGIVTDTGRFLYTNVTENTFVTAGKLSTAGADMEYIYRNLYQSKPIKIMQFENEMIANAEFIGNKVFAVASKALVEKHGVQIGDAENVVNQLRDLDGVDVSMIIKEYGLNEFKASLRSKDVDVSKTARENGGGGHIRASGFTIFADDLDQARAKALKILESIND